jgi:hypothetical protein
MEHILIWEAPPIIKPEFRLYYDDKGKVLFYTCDKPAGKYIVIDANTFAQGRPDIRVVDGKIASVDSGAVVSKLILNIEGISCASEDISIVVDETYDGETNKWKLITYELG